MLATLATLPVDCRPTPNPSAPPMAPGSPPEHLRAAGGCVAVQGLHEPGGGGRAVLAVHPRVVPVHRQWAVVADLVQPADDRRPVDPAVARGTELPAGPRVAAGPVARQDAGATV